MSTHTLVFLMPYSTRPVQDGSGAPIQVIDFESGDVVFLNEKTGFSVQEQPEELGQLFKGQHLETAVEEMCTAVEDYLTLIAPDDTPDDVFEHFNPDPEQITTDAAFISTRDTIVWTANEAFNFGPKIETYSWLEALDDLRITKSIIQQIQKGFELIGETSPDDLLSFFDDVCVGSYTFLIEASHHQNIAQMKRIQNDFAQMNQFLVSKGAKPMVPVLL